jgi:Ca-activated chloride channel family protein
MKLTAKLAKKKYDHNKDSETHLLIELEAPKVEWDKDRAPICIVPVLDVSGSMMGNKLDYLQKACRKLVDHLSPGDLAGIVAYDTRVYEVAPIREVTQEHKDHLKKEVLKLRAGSCTNLSGGMAQALKWINESNLSKEVVLRVVVFTDGLANVGVTQRALIDFTKELKDKATVSAFGFGNDCDQELLADIANTGGGNYAFIDSPDAALTAFARELGGLMSTYGQELEISIKPDKNNEVLEILNDEDVTEKEGVTCVQIRDILGEEKKWIVAKVKLNEVEKPLPRNVSAFKIGVSFKNKDGEVETLDDMAAKVRFCKPGEEPDEEDKDVVLQRDRLLAGKAQDQAEIYARAGDFVQAQGVLDRCVNNLTNASVKGLVGTMSTNYANSQVYGSSRGLANAVRHSFKGKRLSYTSKDAESVCSTAGAQNYTAMDDMVGKFTGSDNSVEPSGTTDDSANTVEPSGTTDDSGDVVEQTTATTKKRSGTDW